MNINLFTPDANPTTDTPIVSTSVASGFPSQADGYADIALDLNKELIRNPSSTFFARVEGGSFHCEGVDDGDLLVIDKSINPYDKCMAVCYIDGDFTLKRLQFDDGNIYLIGTKDRVKPIKINAEDDISIWGVVRYVIKKM